MDHQRCQGEVDALRRHGVPLIPGDRSRTVEAPPAGEASSHLGQPTRRPVELGVSRCMALQPGDGALADEGSGCCKQMLDYVDVGDDPDKAG